MLAGKLKADLKEGKYTGQIPEIWVRLRAPGIVLGNCPESLETARSRMIGGLGDHQEDMEIEWNPPEPIETRTHRDRAVPDISFLEDKPRRLPGALIVFVVAALATLGGVWVTNAWWALGFSAMILATLSIALILSDLVRKLDVVEEIKLRWSRFWSQSWWKMALKFVGFWAAITLINWSWVFGPVIFAILFIQAAKPFGLSIPKPGKRAGIAGVILGLLLFVGLCGWAILGIGERFGFKIPPNSLPAFPSQPSAPAPQPVQVRVPAVQTVLVPQTIVVPVPQTVIVTMPITVPQQVVVPVTYTVMIQIPQLVTPTTTSTATPTATATATQTVTPTQTAPSATPIQSPSATPTQTATPTPTSTPTTGLTATPTRTPTLTFSLTPTVSPTGNCPTPGPVQRALGTITPQCR